MTDFPFYVPEAHAIVLWMLGVGGVLCIGSSQRGGV